MANTQPEIPIDDLIVEKLKQVPREDLETREKTYYDKIVKLAN